MDRLDDMVTFVKVVDARSFTGAAERLGLSKSVVSRRISELEDRLGARLLNRTTRRLSPTEVGLAFYERCGRIIAELEEAERAVGDLHGSPRGRLRINAPVSFGQMHLASAIVDFLERNPAIEIDIHLNDRYVDLLEDGFDMAIRIGRLRDSSLIARRLAPSRRAVVASPRYLQTFGRPERPEDLVEHNCLLYTNVPTSEQWQFMTDEGVRTVRVNGNVRANNGDMTHAAALAGLGIAILPTFLCGEALASGRLERLDLNLHAAETGVFAVYPQNRHLSSKVRTFVDFLAARFGPTPYWDDDHSDHGTHPAPGDRDTPDADGMVDAIDGDGAENDGVEAVFP